MINRDYFYGMVYHRIYCRKLITCPIRHHVVFASAIVSAGKHLSNTYLSVLSIVGTVTFLFIDSVIKSCDSPDWLVHTCYQSASSRVTEAKFLTQKCLSVEILIIVSLNIVIPIIVIVYWMSP